MENIPIAKQKRGEAWKIYQKQRKGWVWGERPQISRPMPVNAEALAEITMKERGQDLTKRETLTKSRTMSVLSTISHSLSRGSLRTINTKSRNFSGSSTGDPTPVTKPSRTALNEIASKSLEPTCEGSEEVEEPEDVSVCPTLPLPDDPRLVTCAMPQQYWTGRFTTLHDQFYGELLEEHNLCTVVEAQAIRSTIRKPNTRTASQPMASSVPSNPSTSVYGVSRIPRQALARYEFSGPNETDFNSTQPFSRVTHAATSGAILETHPSATSQSITSPPRSQRPGRLSQAPPSYSQATTVPTLLSHDKRPRLRGSAYSRWNTAQNAAAEEDLAVANAAILTDEATRRRRVLVHLESLCMTDEALHSFRSWQQQYARYVLRDKTFLPPGGSMHSPPKQRKISSGGLVGRLEGLLHSGYHSHSRDHGHGHVYGLGRRESGVTMAREKQSSGGTLPPPPPPPPPVYVTGLKSTRTSRMGGLRASGTGPDAGAEENSGRWGKKSAMLGMIF